MSSIVTDSVQLTGAVQHPWDQATLPPSRAWLSTNGFSKDGLYFNQILDSPRILISDVASAGDPTLLTQHKIGAILSLVAQPFERFALHQNPANTLESYLVVDSNCAAYKNGCLDRYYFKLSDDGTNTPQQLIAAFELLQEICRTYKDKAILVHCQAGLSRSVSLVAALIAKSERCSFQEAALMVAEHRFIGIHEDLAITLCKALEIKLDRI